MKYADLICFDPIEDVITLTHANEKTKAENLVRSYVMSKHMAEQIESSMLSQFSLDDAVNNKGVFLVGNYGTGKSHLMSVISAIASDENNLAYLQNRKFAEKAKAIAGRFEILRIEIGSVQTPLREIILSMIQQDFAARGIKFEYPNVNAIVNNKGTLQTMMRLFGEKYPNKGYLIAVDEFLDYLKTKDEISIRLDLGFMREIGEMAKESRLRLIFGVQERIFDNPRFSFVSQLINHIRDRYVQVVISKEDTAYVVSERILKKTNEQKVFIRDHLQKFCSLYSNMSERLEEYISLYPIHPSFIDVFNKIYIEQNRHILANISAIVSGVLKIAVPDDAPGIFSFDSYWPFIRDNISYRTDPDIKEVSEKSSQLEDILNRSLPKKLYKPLAIKIIYALSVHRLTTGDIQLRAGLTSENLRDDLCLYIVGLPDQSSDTLRSLVQTVLKDVMTTVSGQFIDYDQENGQYYLDVKKDIDYDEKIKQRADMFADESLNTYFYEIVYFCLDWDEQEYVQGFRLYPHRLIWDSHRIFRRGYLFLGAPNTMPTAEPAEDYFIYFIPPYGNTDFTEKKDSDEIFFLFKPDEHFKDDLKLYAAACLLRDLAETKNKDTYQSKADMYKRKITRFLSSNKNTCFEVIYRGVKRPLLEVMKGRYKQDNPFKETIDLVSSLLLDSHFCEIYPDFPVFKTTVTEKSQAESVKRAFERFGGKKEQLGNAMLDSFGLLSGDQITIQNSKYAKYYADMLDNNPEDRVINFSEIYYDVSDVEHLDKRFKISYGLLPIVFLGLVYTGHAVITLGNGTMLSASELDGISKISVYDIFTFKHISKPKNLRIRELARLYEILDLPAGLVLNERNREAGIEKLIVRAQEIDGAAVMAKSKLDGEFSLWGETLIAAHVAEKYKDSAKRVKDMLGNFKARFNTVAKLNNFYYTMAEIERLGSDIAAVKAVLEYNIFKKECVDNVNYLMNVETASINDELKQQLENAKEEFRRIRDSLADGIFGEAAAMEANDVLTAAKKDYIDLYFTEHKKHRLDVKAGKKKSDLISSLKYANLKRVTEIDILPASKLNGIGKDLAALNVCVDLTPEMLKTSYICPKCHFQLGSNEPPVKGAVERLEDRIDALAVEWTNTLVNAVSDPIALSQKGFLDPDQQKVIDTFLTDKALPQKVDSFFINTVKSLLSGFEAVTVSGTELIDKLAALGPCDMNMFRRKIDEVVSAYTRGKDSTKLRIIVRD